jgi:23S rRNA (cytosine1962-C5)-methyltransferase
LAGRRQTIGTARLFYPRSLMATIVLRPERDRSVVRRHPWIFTGAIARIDGQPASGETVAVHAADGTPLGWGAYSPQSQIAVRMWTFDPAATVDRQFLRRQLELAFAVRSAIARPDLDAYRLVNAESDGLPGLIVDRYGDYLVAMFLSASAEYWKAEIVGLLRELAHAGQWPTGPARGIFERSDVDVRVKEGLPLAVGLLAGEAPPDSLEVREYGVRFAVEIARGHKTGFYLDQRENRALLADYAQGAEVLNGFAYTGGFGVWALRGGAARVTNVDTSASALALASLNAETNGFAADRVENIAGDVFQVLRHFRDARRQFDLIVLDPPKFAESRGQVERATRGYKDINLLAIKLLRPGGTLFTFSCSGQITPELFQKVVAGAALDAGRDVRILRWLRQGPDHPVALNFPEGEYLKGLVCRVVA